MDRFIEISQNNRHLAVDRGFMTVSEGQTELGRIAFDQIGAVIANAHGITYSNNLLVRLAEQKAPLVICGANHVAVSVLLPLDGHYMQAHTMLAQTKIKETMLNRFWKELIQAKIRQQACVLEALGLNDKPLRQMILRVKSGDPKNIEAQAAKYYWQELFGKHFRRDREQNGINALLNYGYTILRSAVIRAIVGAGLHPSLGIHHCNQYNPMCLADDLIEPFRPLIDFCVRRLVSDNVTEVTKESKQRLVSVLSCSMDTDLGSVELCYVLEKLCVSLSKNATNEASGLDLPMPMQDMALWGV